MSRQQGMELWRPDWCKIYAGTAGHHQPDIDGGLVSVTRETCRLAMSALRQQNAQDYYHNYGAAERELHTILKRKN